MTKGTASKSGGKRSHTMCRRCGKHAYHLRKQRCAACGFGDSSKMKRFNWAKLRS